MANPPSHPYNLRSTVAPPEIDPNDPKTLLTDEGESPIPSIWKEFLYFIDARTEKDSESLRDVVLPFLRRYGTKKGQEHRIVKGDFLSLSYRPVTAVKDFIRGRPKGKDKRFGWEKLPSVGQRRALCVALNIDACPPWIDRDFNPHWPHSECYPSVAIFRTVQLLTAWFEYRNGTSQPLWQGALKGLDPKMGFEEALIACSQRARELLLVPEGRLISQWPNAYADDGFMEKFEDAGSEDSELLCALFWNGKHSDSVCLEKGREVEEERELRGLQQTVTSLESLLECLREARDQTPRRNALVTRILDAGFTKLFGECPRVDDGRFPEDDLYPRIRKGPGVQDIKEEDWTALVEQNPDLRGFDFFDVSEIFFVDAYGGIISPFASDWSSTGRQKDHRFPKSRGGPSITQNRQDIHHRANGRRWKGEKLHTFFTVSPSGVNWYSLRDFSEALLRIGPTSLIGQDSRILVKESEEYNAFADDVLPDHEPARTEQLQELNEAIGLHRAS